MDLEKFFVKEKHRKQIDEETLEWLAAIADVFCDHWCRLFSSRESL